MKNRLEEVLIEIKCSNSYLNVKDIVNVYVCLTNNLDVNIENIYIRSFFNNNYLEIINCNGVDECFIDDELICIEKLGAKESKIINLDLLLNEKPYDISLSLFSIIYYEVNINGEYIKNQIKSNVINLNIYNMNLQNFEIYTEKNIYSRQENINYVINISNTGNIRVKNILLKDFVPKGTYILQGSIKVSNKVNFLLEKQQLLINAIEENTSIKINFTIKINEDNDYCYIENNPVLEYENYLWDNINPKKYILKSNLNKVMVNKGSLYGKEGDFIHKVDKEFAYINEIINHKIIINNKNKPKIKNLYFKNTSGVFLKYIERTLFINGVPRNYDNINDYIYIQDSAQDEIIIEYKTKVIDIPLDGKVVAKSSIQYYLADDNYNSNKLCDISSQSNVTIYGVVIDTINNTFNRYQDKKIALIGDIITFTVKIQNIGNVDVVNLVLKEILTPEVTYIENSLTIDNKNNINFDLNRGIEINRIKPNESIKISYKVNAEKITEGTVCTKSSLSYQYSLLNGSNITKVIMSKPTYIKIKGADLSYIKKEVDNNVCKVGDLLTFNLTIINKGNIEALNIKIKDDYLSCFEFVRNSLYLNGKNLKYENIFEGIYLDILNIKEVFNIKYKLKLINIPKVNSINSTTVLEFIHVLNEEKIIKNEILKSNDVPIFISNPIISITDSNSYNDNGILYKYTKENNELNFNILIKNKGNILINKIKLKQVLPEDMEFINDTLKVNERILDNYMFFKDLIIEKLKSDECIEISFKAKVSKNTSSKELKVKSLINYSFFNSINSKIENFEDKLEQKIVIIKPNLKVVKTVSCKCLSLNDDLTETLTLTNEGEFPIEDIVLYLNSYDFLQLNKDSIIIDEFINEFPYDDIIKIKRLNLNESKKISLKYKVLFVPEEVIILPISKVEGKFKACDSQEVISFEEFSNEVNFFSVNNNILLEQKSSKNNMLIEESFEYYLNIKNIGNTICKNAILNINIPKGLKFIENTLVANKDLKNSIITGKEFKVYIEEINVNEVINISLMLKVIDDLSENDFKLNSNIFGEFYLEGDNNTNKETFKSESLILNIDKYDVILNRECDLTYIEPGSKITITSKISNNGTLPIYNAIFSEIKHPLLKVINNSIKINKQSLKDIDIYKGINFGTIDSGKSFTINCSYEYINGGRGEIIEVEAHLNYLKQNNLGVKTEKCIIKNNTINIQTSMSIFKELNINGEIILNINEPNILEISHFVVESEILNYYEIETIKNISYGNQILTGKKILVEGVVREKFEYIIDSQFKSLYFLERLIPFSTFIVIPYNDNCDDITLSCQVKDIYFRNIGSRKIFKSLSILIDGF